MSTETGSSPSYVQYLNLAMTGVVFASVIGIAAKGHRESQKLTEELKRLEEKIDKLSDTTSHMSNDIYRLKSSQSVYPSTNNVKPTLMEF